MSTTTPTQEHRNVSGPSLASLVPFEQICEPGAYVCNWNGYLLRVPADGVVNNGPAIHFIGPEPLFVTKICSNPYVTLTKARLLACNCDIAVNF